MRARAAAFASCAVLIAGCGGVSGLLGDVDLGATVTHAARLRQEIDYPAFLLNRTGATVTLRSASIVGVPGFRAPHLAHVAIETPAKVAGTVGWPPPGVHVARLPGHAVADGHEVGIVYSVTSRTPGTFAVRGVRLTVRSGGATVTVIADGTSVTCFRRGHHVSGCADSVVRRVQDAAAKLTAAG